jgi:hypothetical protein
MTTSVSSYRSGSPRFGTKDTGPVNSEVKISKLTPEELEKYRNGADKKVAGKGNLEEAKRLLVETELPISEIVKRTETNKLTVRTYAQQLRNPKAKGTPQEINTAASDDSADLKHQLKTLTTEKEKLKKQLVDVTFDRDAIKKDVSKLKEDIDAKVNDYIELENEYHQVRNKVAANETVFEASSKDEEIKLLRDSNDYLYQENLALKVRARAYKTAIRELIEDQGI